VHSSKKLFLQYILDAFCTVEGNRLNWVRENQDTIRAENYQGLFDYVELRRAAQQDDQEQQEQMPVRVGTKVILPSTHIGSVRYQREKYNDAMAIVATNGVPDLFLTFTSNPKWPEIAAATPPHNQSLYRPDIEARVFKLKLDELIKDINERHIFGVAIAFIYVIEFQKRGHPHAHLLITLRDQDKPRAVDIVDSLISAELPDRVRNPVLFEIVTSHMLHGPCGVANPTCVCMTEENVCSKQYPKDFVAQTVCEPQQYPIYRRRNDNRTFTKKCRTAHGTIDHRFDNRDVVPYNRFLLLKYRAHINLEVCSSIKAIKYLFKYVYKGHDRAHVEIDDEIKRYIDCRYLSSQEAAWRLFRFEMCCQSHTIYRMHIHLPNRYNVYFVEGQEEQALQNPENFAKSMLHQWFILNLNDEEARQLLYCEVGTRYVWKDNQWRKRKVRKNNHEELKTETSIFMYF
jgi:hypothetical protein